MCPFQILPGLPPYGSEALAFDPSGVESHREGFVVRFAPPDCSPWVGNFQKGDTDLYDVVAYPDSEVVLVISGGMGYQLNPRRPDRWTHFGGSIEFIRVVENLGAIVGNGLWFELTNGHSMIWRTPRISWDGMRDIKINERRLTGQSLYFDGTWRNFSVDLVEGTVAGASYDGPQPD